MSKRILLPIGFLGAIDDKPYHFDPAKGKELLAKTGLPNGFKVTMDTRNNSPTKDLAQAIQSMWGQAGVQVEIIPGDNKQTLTKYRARTHDIYIGQWGPEEACCRSLSKPLLRCCRRCLQPERRSAVGRR